MWWRWRICAARCVCVHWLWNGTSFSSSMHTLNKKAHFLFVVFFLCLVFLTPPPSTQRSSALLFNCGKSWPSFRFRYSFWRLPLLYINSVILPPNVSSLFPLKFLFKKLSDYTCRVAVFVCVLYCCSADRLLRFGSVALLNRKKKKEREEKRARHAFRVDIYGRQKRSNASYTVIFFSFIRFSLVSRGWRDGGGANERRENLFNREENYICI